MNYSSATYVVLLNQRIFYDEPESVQHMLTVPLNLFLLLLRCII